MATNSHATYVIVALGTRGDVQPLACIAQQLRNSFPQLNVFLITHKAHEPWLATGVFFSLPTRYVDSPPAGAWWSQPQPSTGGNSSSSSTGNNTGGNSSNSSRLSEPDARVVDAIRACVSGHGSRPLPLTPHGHPRQQGDPAACTAGTSADSTPACTTTTNTTTTTRSNPQHEQQQPQPQAQQQQSHQHQHQQRPQGRALVLFNLFALEAYHAAEALGLACAVAAPYLIPYTCPPAFKALFRRELPQLFAALGCVAEQEQEQGQEQGQEHGRQMGGMEVPGREHKEQWVQQRWRRQDRVTFAEVDHWMWPLFTERWGEWREQQLGLPALPLHEYAAAPMARAAAGSAQAALAAAAMLAEEGGGEAAGTLRADSEREAVPLPRERLPPAPPLLYGFSELLVPRPRYWPPSVHVCGFWQPPLEWFRGHSLPPSLARLVRQCGAEAARAGSSHDRCGGSSDRTGSGSSCSRLVCVDFGSMGRLGLIPDPCYTMRVLRAALEQTGLVAVVLSAGWRPLHDAAAALGGVELPEGGLAEAEAGTQAAAEAAVAGGGATCCAGPAEVEAGGLADAAGAAGAAASPPEQAPPTKRTRTSGGADTTVQAAAALAPPSGAGHAGHQPSTADTRTTTAQVATEVPRSRATPPPPAAPRLPVQPPPPPRLPVLHLYGSGDVPHQLLLPYCAAVLHHAGSGTTAAALQCGTPQVSCPLHFDQPFWAERLAHLGLSPPPLQRQLLFGSLRERPAAGSATTDGIRGRQPMAVGAAAANATCLQAAALTAAVGASGCGAACGAGAAGRGAATAAAAAAAAVRIGDAEGDGEAHAAAVVGAAAAWVAAALRSAACIVERRRAAEAMAQELACEDGLRKAVELLHHRCWGAP